MSDASELAALRQHVRDLETRVAQLEQRTWTWEALLAEAKARWEARADRKP